ncbi:MAG: hypothetical protein R3281_03170 [Balneolaceae bacterium]|nr:hypothetical protein [Balneolaceae bacterium]
MKNLFLALLGIALLMVACEQPNSPDFKLDQKVQLPLLSQKTYTFLGEKDALIDTTDPDFSDVFSTDRDGQVTLSKQEDFDFGSLDGAIPEVDVATKSVDATVGALSINDFSSTTGNLGSAGFQEVTGLDPNTVSPGTPIIAGSETVEINISTDYLQSATIKGNNGSISVTITNQLGFTIDQVTLTLKAGSVPLGSDQLAATDDFPDGQDRTFEIGFSDDDVLQDLVAEVDVSWNSQQMSDNPDELIVSQLDGQDITASQVQAAMKAQSFFTSGTVSIDDSDFRFTSPDHYVELQSGELVIDQIVNGIDLNLNPLVISFPGIRTAPYTAADSLNIRFEGAERIPRSSSGSTAPAKNISLSDLRIFAENNELTYNIQGTTENTQDGSADIRTISETDQMAATVSINNLTVKRAEGVVVPRNVIVNDDVPENETNIVDLFNDSEAETITIDALEDISDQLDGIAFSNPLMNISYQTNLGISTTIYAGIVGTDASGNRTYLNGLVDGNTGGPNYVDATEIPTELRANGTPLTSEQVIKFTISPPQGGGSYSDMFNFTTQNSNVDEFLNNLPSDIRIISVAAVNEPNQEGILEDPVEFDPSMSVDIPLDFSAANATYEDTADADLGELPDPSADDQRLTEGKLFVDYRNGLPLSTNLTLVMMDSLGNEITRVPGSSGDPLTIGAGSVDSNTRFVSSANDGNLTIDLTRDQLDLMHQTRQIKLEIEINTDSQSSVRIRGDDSIAIKVSLSGAVESTVN